MRKLHLKDSKVLEARKIQDLVRHASEAYNSFFITPVVNRVLVPLVLEWLYLWLYGLVISILLSSHSVSPCDSPSRDPHCSSSSFSCPLQVVLIVLQQGTIFQYDAGHTWVCPCCYDTVGSTLSSNDVRPSCCLGLSHVQALLHRIASSGPNRTDLNMATHGDLFSDMR